MTTNLLIHSTTLVLGMACMTAPAEALTGRDYDGRSCTVKTDASPKVGKAVARRIDNYCKAFAAFFGQFDLDDKNDNKIVAKVFDKYDDFAAHWRRTHGDTRAPKAYFSPSMNAIVLYNDEKDVTLRQTLFHECSHHFFNRYTYSEPSWLNEGLAEYFEGWRTSLDGKVRGVRPNLYDLMIVRKALADETAMPPSELVRLSDRVFRDWHKRFPDRHWYLNYCTAWSIVYYCLEMQHPGDRESMVRFIQDLNAIGDKAEFQVEDWDAFDRRWKDAIGNMPLELIEAEDHLLIAEGHRNNEDWTDAIESYRAALLMDEDAAGAPFGIGYCAKKLGRYEEAIEALTAARKQDPKNARAPYLLARIALGVDKKNVEPRPEQALEYAQAAVDLMDGGSTRYLLLLAQSQSASGDAKRAVKTVRHILELLDKDNDQARAVYKEWLETFKNAAREQKRRR